MFSYMIKSLLLASNIAEYSDEHTIPNDADASHHNILMSLPTCLIHFILSDWVEVVSIIKLEVALNKKKLQSLLLDLLKSDQFFAREIVPTNKILFSRTGPPEHPSNLVLNWCIIRQLKVRRIEVHEVCLLDDLETYLQQFGEHIRHIYPREVYNRSYQDQYQDCDTQNALVEEHCHNLTSYFACDQRSYDGSVLCVLANNPLLETLHVHCACLGDSHDYRRPFPVLQHLRQLKWNLYGDFNVYGDSLMALVKAAPNLRQLSLYCGSRDRSSVCGSLMLEIAQACPHLRTFSCTEMHLDHYDDCLKPFLAICSGIVNLDLQVHDRLTDTMLIDALCELKCLHSARLLQTDRSNFVLSGTALQLHIESIVLGL